MTKVARNFQSIRSKVSIEMQIWFRPKQKFRSKWVNLLENFDRKFQASSEISIEILDFDRNNFMISIEIWISIEINLPFRSKYGFRSKWPKTLESFDRNDKISIETLEMRFYLPLLGQKGGLFENFRNWSFLGLGHFWIQSFQIIHF